MLLAQETIADAIRPSRIPRLDIVPGTADLGGIDVELHEDASRTRKLHHAFQGAVAEPDIREKYDIVLIDCPPSLNLLTVNAMVAADAALVPLQCEFFALEGLSQLLKTIERVQNNLNPSLAIQGIILTMHDRRNNLSLQVEEDVRGALGDLIFDTVIPRNVRLSEAPSFGMPALIYDQKCAGSRAYQSLAAEFLRREASRDGQAN